MFKSVNKDLAQLKLAGVALDESTYLLSGLYRVKSTGSSART